MYKKPIILFGIAVPTVIAILIVVTCFQAKIKVATSYETKVQEYKNYQISRMKALEIETQIAKQRKAYEQWLKVLEQDPVTLLNANMKILAGKLPSKEFQQPLTERMTNKIGFGTVSAQNSEALRFNFKGTFRTTQKALMELETRMPNLQLQELRIDPNTAGSSSIINIQLTYTAWEK
jgi:hypothetical protein